MAVANPSYLTTITGTIGTMAVQVLSGLFANNVSLRVINPSNGVTNNNYFAVTYDNGTTAPVIGSVGFQISPLGDDRYTYKVPFGANFFLGVDLVANNASSPYTIEYEG